MEFSLKRVHMAQYELILRLDGALWLKIILKPLLTQKRAMESSKILEKVKSLLELAKKKMPVFLAGPMGPIHPVWALAAIHPRWGDR